LQFDLDALKPPSPAALTAPGPVLSLSKGQRGEPNLAL